MGFNNPQPQVLPGQNQADNDGSSLNDLINQNYKESSSQMTLWDLIKKEPKCSKYVELLKKLNELISLVGKRNSRANQPPNNPPPQNV